MARASKAAAPAAPSLARRGVALGVFVLSATAFGYGMSRPWVTTLRNESFTLGPGETLSIIGPAPQASGAPLFKFQGAEGRNVIVRVDSGSLDAEAPPELTAALAGGAAGPVPLVWELRRGGVSRANVAVALRPTGPGTVLTLEPGGTPNVPELTLNSKNARLHLVMHGAATEGDELDPVDPDEEQGREHPKDPQGDLIVYDPTDPRKELLRVETTGGGALPVPVVSEPGQPVSIRYAAPGAEGASYQLGGKGLGASSLRVRSETGPDRFTACGATSGIAWAPVEVARLTCSPVLKVTSLAVTADGLVYRVRGSGFVAREGKATIFPLQNFKENPVIGAGLAAVMGLLANWTLRTTFAPWPSSGGPTPPKPVRGAAKVAAGRPARKRAVSRPPTARR